MADSPQKNTTGPVDLVLKANGNKVSEKVKVLSIKVENSFNRIPRATIELLDGSMPDMTFPLSDKADFKPGNPISIAVGYGSQNNVIYQGIIVCHGVSINTRGHSILKLQCADKAQAMAINRVNANFVKQKDSQIITTLIGGHSGLSSDITATTTEYPEIVQFDCSDWDFMLTRAEANGLLVSCDNGKVTVAPPKADSPVLSVKWGQDLIRFDADMDARYQLDKVEAVSWDPDSQKMVKGDASPGSYNKQGNIDQATLAKVLAVKSFNLQTTATVPQGALTSWATGQQVKSGLARIRGKMCFIGNANVKPGCAIEVKGVGARFSGNVFVSGVTHSISNGHWLCDVEFGMSPHWSAEYRDLAAPMAAGRMPGVDGLHVGKVLKIDADPLKQFRVQVSIPTMQAQTPGVWARLASPWASKQVGFFTVPEIGDEVVLGYFNNNPSDPVILGSVYSQKNQPPYVKEGQSLTTTKAMVSTEKLTLEMDDKDKILTIKTPGGNTLVLSDKDKEITITDSNKNSVKMDKDGIVIDSAKALTLKASKDITIDAGAGLTLKAAQATQVKGQSIELTASTSFKAQGSPVEVSSSAITTIKGSLVKIN